MSRSQNAPTNLPARFANLAPRLDEMADEAVAGITVPHERCDPTFGRFGPLAGFIRAAANVEGAVLETGLRVILDHAGSFALLPVEFRLPVTEAAQAAVRNNDKTALVALRLDPKVYASEHYTPDLVAVRQPEGVGYLLELKRATGSYNRLALEQLEEKMLATALVTRDALLSGRRRLVVSRVEVAIVDCSDADRRDGVIGLGGLDELLECPGVAETLSYLRTRFAFHIQSALDRMSTSERQNGVDDGDLGDLDPDDWCPISTEVEDDFAAEPVAISFARKRPSARAQA